MDGNNENGKKEKLKRKSISSGAGS